MSVFAPTTKDQPKVDPSQYIQSQDQPSEGETKPAEPTNPDPTTPEA